MATPGPAVDANLYVVHQDAIERVIATVCRRQRLSTADRDDFASEVRLHLIDRDYAALRSFEGRSSLQAYLQVVVTRQFQDWRNKQWGKWRTSVGARRLGPIAIRLESLVHRDRYTFDQACEIVRTGHGTAISREALERIWSGLPERSRRALTTDEGLETLPATYGRPDEPLALAAASATAQRARDLLAVSLSALSARERLLLRLRFDDGLTATEIARLLGEESKPLYGQIDRVLARLRRTLEAAGLSGAEVLAALSASGFEADGTTGESGHDVRLHNGHPGSPAGSETNS